MKTLLVLLFLTSVPALAGDLTVLGWLSGCWAYDGRAPGSGEYWMPPAGGSMLAVSRTIKGERTAGFEYLRIAELDENSIALFASPSGKAPVRFDLVSLTDNEVMFENPEHDFPQRIIYRLGETNLGDTRTLLGRIEGLSDGAPVAIEFPMTSVDCSAFGL